MNNKIVTRKDIYEKYGGSMQQAFPTVNGKVVCICLDLKLNPFSPRHIYVGKTKAGRVVKAAEQLFSQDTPVPLFHKIGNGLWEFQGNFIDIEIRRDIESIKDAEDKSNRHNEIDCVLVLWKIFDRN